MESDSKTARPYAMAAYKQASEEGKSAQWSEMLALLQRVIEDPDMARLISGAKLKSAQIAEIISDVCGERLSPTGRNFVRVLADSRRLAVIDDIASGFEAERARDEQRSEVVVTSAYELSESEINTISAAMTQRLGTKVDIQVELDQTLIAGVVIRAGDTIIDASSRGRLNQMAQSVA